MSKWYFIVDGREEGPIDSNDLKRRADSGNLKPDDRVRRGGTTDWHEARRVKGLFAAKHTQDTKRTESRNDTSTQPDESNVGGPKANTDGFGRHLSPDDYRMPKENAAFWFGAAVFGVLGIIVLPLLVAFPVAPIILFPILLIGFAFSIWIQQNSLVGSCVAVTERQFPEIFDIAKRAAKRLQMKQPELYIQHSPTLNAFAIGFLGRKSVVLHSATVEAMDEDELTFIVGHEFSHIKCGHTNLLVLSGSVQGISLLGIEKVLGAIFRFHSRQAEYTCDRGGLFACRNPAAAAAALCKLAIGPELFKRMDMDKFLEQQMDLDQNDVARLSESLHTHPYTVSRIRAVAKFHDSEIYRKFALTV